MKQKNGRRKFFYGSMSTVFVVLFIAAVILLNMLLGFLTDRYVLKLDMTENKLYDIGEETMGVLSALDEPITITLLQEESYYLNSTYGSIVWELLQRYVAYSDGLLSVEYINPTLNPTLVQDYQSLGTVAEGDFIIRSERRAKLVPQTELFTAYYDQSTGQTTVSNMAAEQKLTSAIVYTVTEALPKAVFTEGHAETQLTSLESILINGNYEVSYVNLSLNDIPEDTEIVVIAGPTADFTGDEVAKIDAYLETEGNLLLLNNPSAPTLPTLNRYFEEWGVSYEPRIILDMERAVSLPSNTVADAHEHAMIDSITANSQLMVTPNAMPINILWSEDGYRKTYPLFSTSSSSYAKSIDETLTSYNQEEGDLQGPFNTLVLTEQSKYVDNTLVNSRVISGSLNTAHNTILGESAFLNSQFFTAMLNYINPGVDTVIIQPRDLVASTMVVQDAWLRNMYFALFVVLIPVGFLGIGAAVWFKRRNM